MRTIEHHIKNKSGLKKLTIGGILLRRLVGGCFDILHVFDILIRLRHLLHGLVGFVAEFFDGFALRKRRVRKDGFADSHGHGGTLAKREQPAAFSVCRHHRNYGDVGLYRISEGNVLERSDLCVIRPNMRLWENGNAAFSFYFAVNISFSPNRSIKGNNYLLFQSRI